MPRQADTQPTSCGSIGRVNVLALYDIHGNLAALGAVLADPRAANPVVVLSAATSCPVLSLAPPSRIYALADPTGCAATGSARSPRRSAALADPTTRAGHREVTSTSRSPGGPPLGDLPMTLELDGVLYCHATPRPTTRWSRATRPPSATRRARRGAAEPSLPAIPTSRTTSGRRRPLRERRQRRHAVRGRGNARWLGWPTAARTAPHRVRLARRGPADARCLAGRPLAQRVAGRARRLGLEITRFFWTPSDRVSLALSRSSSTTRPAVTRSSRRRSRAV